MAEVEIRGMRKLSLTIIDPQKGFCDSSGSLSRYYGDVELEEIRRVSERIRKLIKSKNKKYERHLLISEYSKGQFSDTGISELCVPGTNQDCELMEGISPNDFESVTTKNEKSALSTEEFVKLINKDLQNNVKVFALGGFLIEHCVFETALDLYGYVSKYSASVVVCRDLVASRSEKYSNGTVDNKLKAMASSGIKIVNWFDIRP